MPKLPAYPGALSRLFPESSSQLAVSLFPPSRDLTTCVGSKAIDPRSPLEARNSISGHDHFHLTCYDRIPGSICWLTSVLVCSCSLMGVMLGCLGLYWHTHHHYRVLSCSCSIRGRNREVGIALSENTRGYTAQRCRVQPLSYHSLPIPKR